MSILLCFTLAWFLTPSCFSASLGHLALVPHFCVTCFSNFFLLLPVHSSSLSSLMPSYQGQDKHTFLSLKTGSWLHSCNSALVSKPCKMREDMNTRGLENKQNNSGMKGILRYLTWLAFLYFVCGRGTYAIVCMLYRLEVIFRHRCHRDCTQVICLVASAFTHQSFVFP